MFPFLNLFGREISLYAIMVLCGIFASGIYAGAMAKKLQYDDTDVIILLLIVSAGVFAGGHLLYAIVNYENFLYAVGNIKKIDTVQKLLNALYIIFGGSVFYGGLLGGILTGYIVSRKNNKYFKFFDICFTSIPLFHFFGRIGCFLGGCCYGIESNIGFTYTNNPIAEANGVKRFPVQIIEALFNIALFLILNHLLRKGKLKNKLCYVYLGVYAAGRFFIEYLRGDAYRGMWGIFSTSQIISVLLILAVAVIICQKRPDTNGRHFFW